MAAQAAAARFSAWPPYPDAVSAESSAELSDYGSPSTGSESLLERYQKADFKRSISLSLYVGTLCKKEKMYRPIRYIVTVHDNIIVRLYHKTRLVSLSGGIDEHRQYDLPRPLSNKGATKRESVTDECLQMAGD